MPELKNTLDPVKPGFLPGQTVATIAVPVDVWDEVSDRWAVGTVHCRIVQHDRVGFRRTGDSIHACVPWKFTGEIRRWTSENGFRRVSSHDGEHLDPTCEGTMDGDPAIADSLNKAIVEIVRDAAKLTADMDRARAAMATAEAIAKALPAGVWL